MKFLGSVQVPYHKGNDVLCAAMQKVQFHLKALVFIVLALDEVKC